MAIIRKEEVKQPKKVSTLGLTPGTPTMRALEADVEDWVEETLLSDNDWGRLHIELSRASVPVSVLSLKQPSLRSLLLGFLLANEFYSHDTKRPKKLGSSQMPTTLLCKVEILRSCSHAFYPHSLDRASTTFMSLSFAACISLLADLTPIFRLPSSVDQAIGFTGRRRGEADPEIGEPL